MISTISNIEDKNYRTIKIERLILGANKEWFADNLNVSHFRKGDSMLQAQECSDWLDACEKGIPARNGLRTANFSSGKDKIYFTAAERNNGAHICPFRYM